MRRFFRQFFRQPLDDVLGCLEGLADLRRPYLALALTAMSLFVTWFVYVPIHELLHVAGCLVTGGEVSRLEIAPMYGAALLAKWFPFVTPGGEYAGRLSGFDWRGSDLIYLATDIAPFLLSILIGVPLLKLCARRGRPLLLGTAIVVGLAPFYNVIGDYYEMASILTTRLVTVLGGGGGGDGTIAFVHLRADDIFKLVGDLFTKPAELGLDSARRIAIGAVIIAGSFTFGILLAFLSYFLGTGVSRVILPRRVEAESRADADQPAPQG